MKKIMVIGNLPFDSDLGRAEIIRTKFILRGLAEEGYKLSVYSYYIDPSLHTQKQEKKLSFNYILSYRKRWRFLNPLVYTFIFFKTVFLQAGRYDYILCDKIPPYYILPFLLAAKLKKKKYVIQYSEFLEGTSILDTFKKRLFFNIGKFFDLLALKKASAVIVISSEHRKYYEQYTSPKCKYVIIPMLMEITREEEKYEQKENKEELVVGYAGTLNKSNGVELLVSAVSEAINQKQKVQLVMFGPARPDYRTYLKDRVKKANSGDKIHILDPMGNKETIDFINKNIDILVIPKIQDSRARGYIPSKLGDYLNSGKPLIVTDVGEMNQYIQHRINGFLISPENPESLTDTLNFICHNYETARAIGQKGRLSARQFDYKKQVSSLSCVIDSL